MNSLSLLVILLFFLSGSLVTAGPIGDFFRKVGQSIPRPRQHQQEPEPQPQQEPQPARPQPAKTPNATRRTSSRAAASTATTSPAETQSARPPKEEEPANTVRSLSAADLAKVKAGLPYGVPVPGRKGMVTSPYTPEDEKYIDVSDFATGSIVKDPYTGKFFLVP